MTQDAFDNIDLSRGPVLVRLLNDYEWDNVSIRKGAVMVVTKKWGDSLYLSSHWCDSCQVKISVRVPYTSLALLRDSRVLYQRTADQERWEVLRHDEIDHKIISKYRRMGIRNIPPDSVVLSGGRNLNAIVNYYQRMSGNFVYCKKVDEGYNNPKSPSLIYQSFIAKMVGVYDMGLRPVIFEEPGGSGRNFSIPLCFFVDIRLAFKRPAESFAEEGCDFIFDDRNQ